MNEQLVIINYSSNRVIIIPIDKINPTQNPLFKCDDYVSKTYPHSNCTYIVSSNILGYIDYSNHSSIKYFIIYPDTAKYIRKVGTLFGGTDYFKEAELFSTSEEAWAFIDMHKINNVTVLPVSKF